MRPIPRRRAAAAAVALALVVASACSDDGDSGAFCERLGDTEQLSTILGDLDPSDPAGLEARLEATLEQFSELEGDAPGAIRDDVARIRQGVALVLEAVQDNPDDLPAARAAIAGELDELPGLAQASEDVVAYARTECDLDLGEGPASTDDEDGATTTTTEG
ncbi:hypothetical protein HC251_15270 [Iamia sp. SCSIO 61187]|uniref:hypothetical protein n=1 Tax=Iamia sp. SCSIO 61187 TaxID=2722752 RepID=UPI001C62D247|nr:hypothetical protein [Iamia sp. SCSIO 61187]QYG93650.1 hypothetical protein HC251_15270 [Iamia sp. SCSIO 61187]